MKKFKWVILGTLLLTLMGPVALAKDSNEMLSGGYSGNEILIFPESSIGPNGNDIITFVVLGAEIVPTVLLDTGDKNLENVKVTKITFELGIKFFGFFEIPEKELYTIWVNNNEIIWEEIR